MEMIEPTDPYERGFIDGMAKQRDSAVQRFVEGGTSDSELAEHKRIIREQQAEIDRLKSLCISYIDEEWLGTSSYQNKIDEVNNDCKKINR